MSEPQDRLMTISEAAAILHLHPVTLRRHLRNGTITGVRIGNRYFISSRTLERVLAG